MIDKKSINVLLILVIVIFILGCIGRPSTTKDIRVDDNSKVSSDILISQISVSEAPDFNPNIQRDIVIWTSKEKGIDNIYMKNLSNNEVSILFKNVSSAGIIEDYVYYSAPMAQEDAVLYNVTLILDVGLGWKDTSGALVPLKYGGYVLSYEGPITCDSEFRYAFEKIENNGARCELSGSITKGYNLSTKKTEIIGCKRSFCFENLEQYNGCLEQKKLWSKRVAGDNYNSLLDAPNFINLSGWMCNNTFQGAGFPTTARRNIVDDAGKIRIGDMEVLLKWEDGFYERNLIKMYKDLSDVNPFYKNLTDADLLKKVDGLIVKKYFRCYNWEGKDSLYSSKECTDRQDILKIYYPKKDKIYVLEGNRYKFSGPYSSKSELVSRGLFNEIKDIKSFDNKFVWVDNINQKCIKLDGKQECDGNTDVYMGIVE